MKKILSAVMDEPVKASLRLAHDSASNNAEEKRKKKEIS